MYLSTFGRQINNFMIIEKSNLSTTNFVVSIEKKLEKNLLIDLFDKIEKKQREPFAKIYITVPLELFKIILIGLNKKDFRIKNLHIDKNVAIFQV